MARFISYNSLICYMWCLYFYSPCRAADLFILPVKAGPSFTMSTSWCLLQGQTPGLRFPIPALPMRSMRMPRSEWS